MGNGLLVQINAETNNFAQSGFIVFIHALISESNQRSENLYHERLKLKYEKPPVQRGPYLTSLLSGPKQSYVTVTCDMAQCFRSAFCQNRSGLPSENSLR